MKKIYIVSLIFIYIAGCKNSKPDFSGDEKISAEDFIKAFHSINLPVTIADTALENFGDTITISKTVFIQFVPDSALDKFSEKADKNLVIHPAGIIHKKERDFLLATFSSKQNLPAGRQEIKLMVFVLDDKHKFLASFPLLNKNEKNGYNHSVSITEEPTFIIKKEKISSNNTSLYSRNGYSYNVASGLFAQVLHDSNEDTARNNEIINPIDTFPSTNKYSGNYIKDKTNFIAVRDGKSAITYSFFIHFEKGDCTGELKGMMSLTDEKNAVFTESGDPCAIDFKFTGNSIRIKEQGNCGNHRGITCPFDFSFKKKTPSATKQNK